MNDEALIQDGLEKLTNCYFELSDKIYDFIEYPCRYNKNRVKEKMAQFNSQKNKLSHMINDYWCKGE